MRTSEPGARSAAGSVHPSRQAKIDGALVRMVHDIRTLDYSVEELSYACGHLVTEWLRDQRRRDQTDGEA